MRKTIEELLSTGDHKIDLQDFQTLANLGETRFVEKKSIRLLDSPKTDKEIIKGLIGKEVSAFANYEGGIILLGINDKTGEIEDGIDNELGNQTIKEWLEDILYISINPSINNFAVKIIEKEKKFLFALIIAPSSLAPHQCSTNYIFYGRIDGKSKPLNGLMVRDILSRKGNTNIIPNLNFRLITYNNPTFCLMTLGIENNSNIGADEVLAIVSIETPDDIMNGVYNEGKSFFRNNVGQLYADIVYPKVNQTFKSVQLRKFESFKLTINLVARNFPLTKFSFIYEYKDGNIVLIENK